MISVLIPVYNFDITQLVSDLHQQLLEVGIPFEILCFDDNSDEKFDTLNQSITNKSQIIFQKSLTNLGRARMRNALAKAAIYPYLLFMDCDSRVISPNYIRHYKAHLRHDTLLYGGRSYAPTPPNHSELYFHWHYGTQREQTPADIRQQTPYHAFMTNNFLVPKAIFEHIQFDERLTKYGHEDTLFGLALYNRQIKILHLDNTLEHIGLEKVAVFLQKTEQGIQNLAFLAQENPQLNTRLLQTYRLLKKWQLIGFTSFILTLIKSKISQNLKSKKPNLKWFDLYKLHLLITTMKVHRFKK